MQWALNTLMWWREPLAAVLRHAEALGVPALDLGALPGGVGHLPLPAGEALSAECEAVLSALPAGFSIVAVTADHAGLSADDEEAQRQGIAYTLEAMRAAAWLGAGVVGTSLGSVGEGRTWAAAAKCAVEALREVMRQAPEGMSLAIEIHVNDVCNSLEKAEHFLTEIDDGKLGVAFDTSLLHWNGIPTDEAFRRLGGRLRHVHLRGATRETYFAIPGRDEVDFPAFLQRLLELGYEGALSLELYEVPERHGISVVEAVREALSYLRGA
jgi:sugar phosphate isomerase/epimerase